MVRNVLLLAILSLMSVGGWFAYDKFHETEALKLQLEERARVIDRLTRTRRVAQAMVVRKFVGEDGVPRTEVLFVEEGEDGRPKDRRRVIVRGEQVYFDAFVLKFDQGLVAEGDPIKGRSLILFRRIFGEDQAPNEGEPLDDAAPDGIPAVYRSDAPSQVEKDLWRDFWRYANEPELRRRDGVRVAQGEAPSVRMEKGKLYELTLDQSGGLNVAASDVPAIFMEDDG